MRLITCLTANHSPGFLLVAVAICAFGMTVAVSLMQRAMNTRGSPRFGWMFLTAVCAGATVWTTHFISILGHLPGASVRFEPIATILSVIAAIVGIGIGVVVALESPRRTSAVLGGGLIGLSIPAMHYTGMTGYKIAGTISWHQPYILASVAAPTVLCMLAVTALHRWREGRSQLAPILLFTAAVASAHFLGMSGMDISPFLDASPFDASETQVLALAVALVALIVMGMGVSCYLIEERTELRFNERMFHATFQDPLTGLANRRALQERMEEAFRADRWFKLLLVDIDHFKLVNDRYGSDVGDLVLVAIAERMRQIAGTDSLVFRVGDDDLAIVVFENRESALQMADDVVISLRSPYSIEAHVVTLGCSVGLCGSNRATDAAEILRFAEAALHEAKRRGRNQISSYSPGMEEAGMQRMKREIDLKTAIDKKEFFLAYQPVVDTRTRRPIGYEALIRWNQPGRGLVSPADFIPLAEETGLILPLGKWVLEEACREAASWPGELHVAVNVSALQFRSPMFLSHVTQALAQSGLPAHRLEVELTETAIVSDGEQLAHVLQDLRVLGVKIAMDDFGTGYSSLSHLRDLPLDRVKIDRSFVAAAAEDRNSMAVLRAVTQLGRDMGIATLGEGVETEEQFAILEKLGCDAIQGYLTGRPEPRVNTRDEASAA